MIPVSPDITIRRLEANDAEALHAFLNNAIHALPYSTPFSIQSVHQQIFLRNPASIYPVRWQNHFRFCAWRAGKIVGFADAATGFDSANLDRPEHQPIGLLRFLALPPDRADLIDAIAFALLQAAEKFWLDMGTRYIRAFDVSTGYSNIQGGAGMLPGEWSEHFRLMTVSEYTLVHRYQAFARQLDDMVEESYPSEELISLQPRGTITNRRYQLFHRRLDLIGNATMVGTVLEHAANIDQPNPTVPMTNSKIESSLPTRVAVLTGMHVEHEWRSKDLGKLLLRRAINDAVMLGYKQMLVYLPQGQNVAWGLLIRHGFKELDYRGYVFEKTLYDQ